jgi:hypothetical protein
MLSLQHNKGVLHPLAEAPSLHVPPIVQMAELLPAVEEHYLLTTTVVQHSRRPSTISSSLRTLGFSSPSSTSKKSFRSWPVLPSIYNPSHVAQTFPYVVLGCISEHAPKQVPG